MDRAAVELLKAIARGERIEWEPIDDEGNVIGPSTFTPSPADEAENRRRAADLN